MEANSPISTMSEIKTYVKLDNWLQVSTEVQGPDLVSGLFSWIPQEMERSILSANVWVVTSFTWLACGIKMMDYRTEMLIIQDVDLGLETQEYFQLSLYSSEAEATPNFSRN